MAIKKNQLPHTYSIRTGLLLLLGLSPLWVGTVLATGTTGTTAEWTSHGGNLEGTHYSELSEINLNTIGTLAQPKLIQEFALQTGVNGSHMGAPLVVGTTLYVVTPFPNVLTAYDLSTGKTKWTYKPTVNRYAFGVNCCDTVNRGPAYANGLVVYNTLDDATVAVNALTGTLAWRTTLADPHSGVTTNGATLIVPNKAPGKSGSSLVIVGSSSGEMGVRGWVKALDLTTGTLVWTAYTTGSDQDVLINPNTYKPFYAKDKAGDQGISSWEANKWQQGGSSVWGYISYDAANDLLFYGTSQPGVWNADQRPGDNKWGASIFARTASTGEARWIYQVTPHDQWDYDSVSESTAIDLATPVTTASGDHNQVLVHFDKNGFAYTFDRLTGEVLSAPSFGAVPAAINWADHIDLVSGLPVLNLDANGNPAKATHQGAVTKDICPSAMGMKGWEPSAYSPKTNTFFVPTFNLCMDYEGLKAEYIAGAPYMGMDIAMKLGPAGLYMGEMVAWDVAAGGRKWTMPEPAPVYGGVLATAGNLIFYGTLDNTFKARNADTGALVFTTPLECSTVGSPISFTGADGHQRIAVFSGVGWLAGGFTATGKPCPGRTGSETTGATNGGGRVHIYKLAL
jgi:alcohol dehydrogenase (cytochrome c)